MNEIHDLSDGATKRLITLVASSLIIAVGMSGCVSSAPTLPRLVKAGDSAYKKQRYDEALQIYTNAQDLFSNGLTSNSEYAESRKRYEDSQIIYGTRLAEEALASGNSRIAWLWYALVAKVDPTDSRCQEALNAKATIESEGMAHLVAESEAAQERGDSLTAAMLLLQLSWMKGEPFETVSGLTMEALHEESETIRAGMPADRISVAVRPDVPLIYSRAPGVAPYGLPVYYGDVPVPYEALGDIRVAGVPKEYSAVQRQYYGASDSLYFLTQKAQKKGADALINVSYKRRGRDLVTEADMIRFKE